MNLEALKSEMDRQKVSAAELSRLSGVDKSTISRILNGVSGCSVSSAKRIALALKLKPKLASTIFFEE